MRNRQTLDSIERNHGISINVTWGCVCHPGKPCAYHAQLARIEDGCRLGGISLVQRLAAVDYSTIVEQRREASIIRMALAERRRTMVADNA